MIREEKDRGSSPGLAALWAVTGRRRGAVATRSGLAVPEGRMRRRGRAGGKGRSVDVDWRMRTPGVGTAAAEVAGDML